MLVASMLLLAGCAEEPTSEVTLDQLAGSPSVFDGERVRTRGVVHGMDDPEHYWIETRPANRLGIHPGPAVAQRMGEPVMVEGRFTWHPEQGRRLRVDSVTPMVSP